MSSHSASSGKLILKGGDERDAPEFGTFNELHRVVMHTLFEKLQAMESTKTLHFPNKDQRFVARWWIKFKFPGKEQPIKYTATLAVVNSNKAPIKLDFGKDPDEHIARYINYMLEEGIESSTAEFGRNWVTETVMLVDRRDYNGMSTNNIQITDGDIDFNIWLNGKPVSPEGEIWKGFEGEASHSGSEGDDEDSD